MGYEDRIVIQKDGECSCWIVRVGFVDDGVGDNGYTFWWVLSMDNIKSKVKIIPSKILP